MSTGSSLKTIGLSSIVLVAILAGAIFLRLYNIEKKPVWYDETVSISHAEKPLLFYLTSFRVTYKPVYFFLLNRWLNFFDEGVFGLRIFSVIWGILNIYLLFRLGRMIFDKETGLIGAFFLSISVFHVFHCQQIRQFSFITFLATSSFYYFTKYCKHGRIIDLGLLLLVNVLLINTYPTGFFIVLVEAIYAFIFIRGDVLRKWIWSQAALAIFVVRWILVADTHHMLEMMWWMKKPGFCAIWETLETFSWGGPRYGLDDLTINVTWLGLMWPMTILYIFLLIRGLNNMRHNSNLSVLIYMWLAVPLALMFAYSVFNPVSVFAIKHLIISLPAFIIISASGLASLKKWWKPVVLILLVLLNVLPLRNMYRNYYSSDWKNSTAYLTKNIKQSDTVIISTLSEIVTFMYYFDKKKRNLEDVDIYGKITPEKYQNDIFTTSNNNLIIGVQQTGFGARKVTTRSDFDQKMALHRNIRGGTVWTLLSRWSVPEIRDIIFPFLEKTMTETECLNFQGVEVCRFEPVSQSHEN